jgi:guanylate kinase
MIGQETSAKLFVLAAPSGAGKTTLVRELMKRRPELQFSVSYTTRRKRITEENGRDYHFVDAETFLALQRDGELLESALVFDNHYGTGRRQVEAHLAAGRHVILEIDWQGARQVREAAPDCISVFILPPSREALERRLRNRRTDSDAVIERRLRDALSDMSHWNEFDYVIVNDDLQQAVTELEKVIDGEAEDSRVSARALAERVRRILGNHAIDTSDNGTSKL